MQPQPGPTGFTHQLTPSSLLSAAEQLYGDVPEAMSITLAGWSFDLSNELSPGAAHRFPEMIRLAQDAVETHRRRMQAESLAQRNSLLEFSRLFRLQMLAWSQRRERSEDHAVKQKAHRVDVPFRLRFRCSLCAD